MLASDPALRSCTGSAATLQPENQKVSAALQRAFHSVDEDILHSSRQEQAQDGSTGLVLLRIGMPATCFFLDASLLEWFIEHTAGKCCGKARPASNQPANPDSVLMMLQFYVCMRMAVCHIHGTLYLAILSRVA